MLVCAFFPTFPTMTSPLAAWGLKFLPDPKCQHHCPDNFYSVTLSPCLQMHRTLIGAGEKRNYISISLLGDMKLPHTDLFDCKKRISWNINNQVSVLIRVRHEVHLSNINFACLTKIPCLYLRKLCQRICYSFPQVCSCSCTNRKHLLLMLMFFSLLEVI